MNAERPVLVARHYWIITAAFTLFILYGSLVPLNTRSLSWNDATGQFAKAAAKGVRIESKSDFAANVILFVPLGFVAAGAVSVDRRNLIALLGLIPVMALLSASIEFLQLWFPSRNTTFNDIGAETFGGIIGVGLWFVFGQDFTNRVRMAWADLGPGDWAVKALPAYVFCLVIVHGMPFDLTLSPSQVKKKYDNGFEIDAAESGAPTIAVTPYPRQIFEKTLLNIAYFLPVGALLAQLSFSPLSASERGVGGERFSWGRSRTAPLSPLPEAWRGRKSGRWQRPESAGLVLGVGLAIAGGIEAVQLIVLSAGTYASDVLCGGLIVLGGWWLAIQPRPLSLRIWAGSALAWGVAMALCYWAPYDFAPDRFGERLGKGEWMPFADYYAGNYIAAFNRIINKTVVFAPLGFAFVRAMEPEASAKEQRLPSLTLQALIVGAVLSAIIEVGQPLFNDHRASSSDIILGAVGTGLGALLASRVGKFVGTER